jgi:hypothetical protein
MGSCMAMKRHGRRLRSRVTPRCSTRSQLVVDERFVAYTLLGSLFMAAHPRHFVKLAIFLAVAAPELEALQHPTSDRHAHVAYAMEKITVAWAGCAAVRLLQVLTEGPQPPKAK